MDGFTPETQLALVSFLIAMGIGGPVALFGAGNVFQAGRIVGGFALRHRMVTGLGLSLAGGAGLMGSGLLGLPFSLLGS
mgnify:CR=1 FL=1